MLDHIGQENEKVYYDTDNKKEIKITAFTMFRGMV